MQVAGIIAAAAQIGRIDEGRAGCVQLRNKRVTINAATSKRALDGAARRTRKA